MPPNPIISILSDLRDRVRKLEGKIPRVAVRDAITLVSVRSKLHFIAGATVVDDPTNDEVDITCTGGGGAIADHDHSGNAGDGGTFDAANLTSGASGDGDVLTSDGAGGAAWEPVPAIPDNVKRHEIVFSGEGNLTTGEKPLRIYPPTGNWTIEKVRAAVDTAPGTQAAIFDIHLNGVTIFTDQNKRAQIAAGTNLDDSDAPDITAMDGDDYLQQGVDQIGIGPAGADWTVAVIFVAV